MLLIDENSINIPGYSELKEFQDMYPIFKPSTITLAVDCLKEMDQRLPDHSMNNIWPIYSAFFGELFFHINNISDLIDRDKVPDEIKGKVLNISIHPLNPFAIIL